MRRVTNEREEGREKKFRRGRRGKGKRPKRYFYFFRWFLFIKKKPFEFFIEPFLLISKKRNFVTILNCFPLKKKFFFNWGSFFLDSFLIKKSFWYTFSFSRQFKNVWNSYDSVERKYLPTRRKKKIHFLSIIFFLFNSFV